MMQFISENLVNTTSLLSSNLDILSATSHLIDRKDSVYRFSVTITANLYGYIKVSFYQTTPVSLICLKDVSTSNCYSVRITRETIGAEMFFTATTGDTTSSRWSTFTGNKYYAFATQSCKDIYFRADFTTTAGTMGTVWIGELFIGDVNLNFEYDPDIKSFNPVFNPKQFIHEASDGGIIKYKLQDSYSLSLSREYISQTEYDSLKDLYDKDSHFSFIPFPTGTAWDGELYEVNWINNWNFKFSDNYKSNGYSGEIELAEIPK